MGVRVWRQLGVASFAVLIGIDTMGAEDSGIHVTGRGEVMVEPDMARMTLQVTRQGRDAASLKQELDDVTAEVLSLTRKLKIDREDVTAAMVSIHPNRRVENRKTVIDGVVASRSIVITLRDLDRLVELTNRALALGINDLSGVQLDSSRRQALEDEALALAISDAQREAEQVAQAFAVRVLGILNVHVSAHQARPMRARLAMESADSSSFSPGQIAIQREVQATFAIGGQ